MKFSEFCAAVERYHWRHHALPTLEDFNKEFITNIKEETWSELVGNPKFIQYLKKRNISTSVFATAEMIEIVDGILDSTYSTIPLKMRAIGKTIHDYNRVKFSPVYQSLLEERMQTLDSFTKAEVVSALAKRASEGSVSAQKLYLELQGHYVPYQKVEQNVTITNQQEVIVQFIEILQRHLSRDKLAAVVREFEAVLQAPGSLPKPQVNEDLVLDV